MQEQNTENKKSEQKKDLICLGVISIVFFIIFGCFFSSFGDPIIDCGREAFIPLRIMNGEVLFKDIFCVYGAFPYYFGALMYKIFSPNLLILRFVGAFLSLGIVCLTYFISREFLNRILSVSLVFFVMSLCVFSVGIFNFIFPYSYAMVWALFGFLSALFFLIKYLKNPIEKYASLSLLFWGLSVVCKQDYVTFAIPLALSFCYFKPLKNPKVLFYALVFPLITVLGLLINRVSIFDILHGIELVKSMLATKSLKLFYTTSAGMYFEPKMFASMLTMAVKNILCLMILIHLILLSKRIRYKFIRILAIVASSCLIFFFVFQTVLAIHFQFSFFPILLFLILVYNLIKFYKDKSQAPYLMLILAASLASLKNFFYLCLSVYGTFPMTILIVAIVISLYRFFEGRLHSQKYITLALALVLGAYSTVNFCSSAIQFSQVLKYPIKTKMGTFKTSEKISTDVNELVDFILRRTDETDKVVVLPEGQMINFLTKRPSGVYYDSLTPLYFETFKEDIVIKDFQKVMPKYIVLSNRNTSEYGASHLCLDYGRDFCVFVAKNYENEAIFGSTIKFFVFRLKKDDDEK